jgi:type I restriction enzyme, S subunit
MSLPRYTEYKDSGVEWLGEVPEHWEINRLRHCLALLTERAESCQNKVALENIQSWSGQYLPSDSEFEGDGIAFQKHDILFGKLRPYLAKVYLADAPGEAVGDFHVMRPRKDVIPRYAQYQMLNRDFIALVDGSTFGSKMPRASWEFVGNMPFPLPQPSEQTAIAAFLDHEIAKIDRLIAEQEKLIALLAEKRQAIVSQAVIRGLNPDAPMKESGVAWLGKIPSHWVVKPLKTLFRQLKRQGFQDKDVLSVYRDFGVVRKNSRNDNLNKTPDDLWWPGMLPSDSSRPGNLVSGAPSQTLQTGGKQWSSAYSGK